MRFGLCARALPLLLVLLAPACSGGGETFSDRELRAASLIEAQVGETVTCHDNGAVNSEILPKYPVGYTCYNDDGLAYGAVVSYDGVLSSLSGPVRLKLVGS